jgi:hypothetical protein
MRGRGAFSGAFKFARGRLAIAARNAEKALVPSVRNGANLSLLQSAGFTGVKEPQDDALDALAMTY